MLEDEVHTGDGYADEVRTGGHGDEVYNVEGRENEVLNANDIELEGRRRGARDGEPVHQRWRPKRRETRTTRCTQRPCTRWRRRRGAHHG